MSLGDQRYNSNGNGARRFDSTYYSRLSFYSPISDIKINITYSTGLMKITFAKANGTNGNGFKNWEDQIAISLTGTKATSLLKSLASYEQAIADNNISMNNAYGVVTGMNEIQTVIQFHLNKVNSGKAFTIAQIDKSGSYLKRFTYEFPDEYDFRIEWQDMDSMKFEKVFDAELQYEMLKQAIKEFSETCNGAAGYNAVDLARYDINSIKNLLNTIGGVSGAIPRNNNGGGSNGGFFANNQPQGQSSHKSLDQIQSEYLTDDDED